MKKSVYIIGKTNVGKTSLFNELTGMDKKVANYHGATTTLSKASLKTDKSIELNDLPGVYNLKEKGQDEALTLQTLANTFNSSEDHNTTLWLVVLDAVELLKGLVDLEKLLGKFSNKSGRVVVAINMIDEADFNNITIKFKNLKDLEKISFIKTSVSKKINLDVLSQNIQESFSKNTHSFTEILKDLKSIDTSELVTKASQQKNLKRLDSVDKVLLSKFWGKVFFCIIMLILFQSVFSWATPFMDLIEYIILRLGGFLSQNISNSILKSFVEDALFGGLGSFLVFFPQIFILTFLIKILEDSGYLTRAAIICNRFLAYFGLSGESFIPLLASHACAIPGIYAARSIKSVKVRVLTLLSLPLTLCSARLPVYALLITLTLPDSKILGGLFGLRGLCLFVLYLFGLTLALILSSTLSRLKTVNSKTMENSTVPDTAFELSRYRLPSFTKSLKIALQTSYRFVKDAGFIIFLTNSFIWLLATFPNGPGHMSESYLSRLGKALHFVFIPLGLNWQESVALITSFLARETFVSTLGTLYNLDSEEILPLAQLISQSEAPYRIASSVSLIIFFAIALQCVSTLALLKSELPKKIWTLYLFIGYFAFAYVLSFIAYRLMLTF